MTTRMGKCQYIAISICDSAILTLAQQLYCGENPESPQPLRRCEKTPPKPLVTVPDVCSKDIMRYEIKWKGYEDKKDRTWETEDNLA